VIGVEVGEVAVPRVIVVEEGLGLSLCCEVAASGAERTRALNPRCARKRSTRPQAADFDDDLAGQILDSISNSSSACPYAPVALSPLLRRLSQPEAERVPGRVEINANILLGLIISEGCATRSGVCSCALEIVDAYLEVHHHLLVSGARGPDRSYVERLGLERQSHSAVG